MIANLGKSLLSRAKANPALNRLGRSTSQSARDFGAHMKAGELLESTARVASKRKVQYAGIGAVGATSFVSGLDSNRQISNSFYDLTTGSPNYDNYALGTDVGVRGLFAPLPGERMMRQSTIKPGAYGGGIAGGLAGLKLSGLKGGLIGGAVGSVAGQSLFAGATGLNRNAVLTTQTYKDAHRRARRNAPAVDGSMAFGMYNARLG